MTGAPAVPYRQLSRLATEFYLSGVQAMRTLLPVRLVESALFLLIARVCAPDWIGPDDTLRPPGTASRSITTHAVAASLQRSPESVRRQVGKLLQVGMVTRQNGGLTLATDPDNAARVIAYFTLIHDNFVGLLEAAVHTADLPLAAGMRGSVGVGDILLRAMDINLLTLDRGYALDPDWQMMAIWIAIGAVNIRHVTTDPQLSRQFAIASSPDDLRRPVALLPIAEALKIPYATVWRMAGKMEQAGLVAQRDNRWVVLTEHLRQEGVERTMIANMDYLFRKMRELTLLGFDLTQPQQYYLSARPPLVPI